MTGASRSIVAAAALLLAVSAPGTASATGAAGHAKEAFSGREHIAAGRPALAPFAYVQFCKKNPEQCRAPGGPEAVAATPEALDELARINGAVNRAIRPAGDRREGGLADRWELDPAEGDCEDYALSKRDRLVKAGWPAAALRLAVVRTSWGEGHAVLVVRTDKGDLVLDNLTDRVKPWRKTGLQFVKIQSGDKPKVWYAL